MNSYDVIIKNEDYTLGYLLQYSMYKLFKLNDNKIKYISVNKPHPLINELLLKISLDNSIQIEQENKIIEYIKNLISSTVKHINSTIVEHKKIIIKNK